MASAAMSASEAHRLAIRNALMETLQDVEPSNISERDIEISLKGLAKSVCERPEKYGSVLDFEGIALEAKRVFEEYLEGENDKLLEYIGLTTEVNAFMYMELARTGFLSKRCNKAKHRQLVFDHAASLNHSIAMTCLNRGIVTRGQNPLRFYTISIKVTDADAESGTNPHTATRVAKAGKTGKTNKSRQTTEQNKTIQTVAEDIINSITKRNMFSIDSWSDALNMIVYCVGMANTFRNLSGNERFDVVDQVIQMLLGGLVPGPFNVVALAIYRVVGRTLLKMLVSMAYATIKKLRAKWCPTLCAGTAFSC